MSNVLGGGPAYADPRSDNRPLSDQEQQLVQRLLSDPISFPMVFKTWMVSFLSISEISLPMTNILGLNSALGLTPGATGTLGLLNTGTCVLYAGAVLPANCLLCNGGAYNTTTYPALFAAIGYAHGGGSGVFNVPNIPAPVASTQWVIVT